ncbi:MAG: hypothetical protein FWC10_10500 [Lentimicrobiaceae bacterium]|nr:hypothetical protein [Lentimicrobiaceae bacterium]
MGNGCIWFIIGIIILFWASKEPISLCIVIGIFFTYLIVNTIKDNKFYRTLMKEKKERESRYPIDNKKNDFTLSQIHTIKAEKTIITCLEELYCWIHENTQLLVRESGEDYFIIQAPNKTDLKININESQNINVNIKRIIKQLEKFDGSEKSKKTMNFNFAASDMLDFPIFSLKKEWNEAEFDFHSLAEQLRELLPTEKHDEDIEELLDYDDIFGDDEMDFL